MAHELLQRTQVRPVFKQVYRKAVAQGMGGDLFFNTGLCLVKFENLPKALAAHAGAANVYKQRLLGNIGNHGRTRGENMLANPVLLQKKYARIVEQFAKAENLTLSKALGIFYHSDTYELMSKGISDMHCMSDGYLVEELQQEYGEQKLVK